MHGAFGDHAGESSARGKMTIKSWWARLPRGVFAAAFGMCLIHGASGCISSEYAGIPLGPRAAAPELRQLAQRARTGDKQAQLALGIRFEEGNGVAQDRDRAIALYRQASSNSGGTIWVYSPAVGNGTRGRIIPIDRGPAQVGLPEAKARLLLLRTGQ